MTTQMERAVFLDTEGDNGILMSRSVSTAVGRSDFATAVPLARALKRDAANLDSISSNKRIFSVRLTGVAEEVVHAGAMFLTHTNVATVVQADIRRIKDIAQKALDAALTEAVEAAAGPTDLLERIRQLQATNAQLKEANTDIDLALEEERARADKLQATVKQGQDDLTTVKQMWTRDQQQAATRLLEETKETRAAREDEAAEKAEADQLALKVGDLTRQLQEATAGEPAGVRELQEQLSVQMATFLDLQEEFTAQKAALKNLQKTTAINLKLLEVANGDLLTRLQRTQEDLRQRDTPQVVAQLRRRILELEGRSVPEGVEGEGSSEGDGASEGEGTSEEEGASEATPVHGPIYANAQEAVSDLFNFDKKMPIALKGPLAGGSNGVVGAVTNVSIREIKPFAITPGPVLHNIGPEPEAIQWNLPAIGWIAGQMISIIAITRGRPPWVADPAWVGLRGALVGYTAFLKVSTTKGVTYHLSISKEVTNPVLPKDKAKWTGKDPGDLQWTDKDGAGKPMVPYVYAVEQVQKFYADDIYPGSTAAGDYDINFAPYKLFHQDKDWKKVTANITLIYVYGDGREALTTAFGPYKSELDRIRNLLASGKSITYADAQKSKLTALTKLADQKNVLFVTYQGIVGEDATPPKVSGQELPDQKIQSVRDQSTNPPEKQVTWLDESEEDSTDW